MVADAEMLERFNMHPTDVEPTLPKFRREYELEVDVDAAGDFVVNREVDGLFEEVTPGSWEIYADSVANNIWEDDTLPFPDPYDPELEPLVFEHFWDGTVWEHLMSMKGWCPTGKYPFQTAFPGTQCQ